jgi:transposase
MAEKQTFQPTDWREGRRLRAWELEQAGWRQKDIAEALGVTPGAVSQWLKRAREKGVEDLKRKTGAGAPRRLSDEQLAQLPDLLHQGAEHFGFRGDVWTRKRVATVIRQVFKVSYSERHVGRLLKSIGWTRQKPIHRASERDETAIQAWSESTWPEHEKKPSGRGEP